MYTKLTAEEETGLRQGYRQYSRVDVDTCLATSCDTSDLSMMDTAHLDPESDNEDDPTKLLNQWLGELNTLKKVSNKD